MTEDNKEISWVWSKSTVGKEKDLQQFPLLARLGIPLGRNKIDAACRSQVIQQLLSFNDLIEDAGKQVKPLKLVRSYATHVLKVPGMRSTDPVKCERSLRKSRVVDVFLECMTAGGDKEEASFALCRYLAKHYSEGFCANIEIAQELKNKRSEKIHREPPHVRWNMFYQQLLNYKQLHGNCTVPSIRANGLDPRYRDLAKWVTMQRSYKKMNAPILTPQRIELLESIGFVWEVSPGQYSAKEDPNFLKAVAAKLYFQPTLTAKEAMLMSGFSEQETMGDEKRTKHVNEVVRTFYTKEARCKNAIEQIIDRLKEANGQDAVVQEVFGQSEILAKLKNQGKLVPRGVEQESLKPSPAKRQKTDNSSSVARGVSAKGPASSDRDGNGGDIRPATDNNLWL